MSDLGVAIDLFGVAWATMLLAAIALAWPGVLVVARGQIVLAIAAAQAAACGAAAAMALIGWMGGGHVHGDGRIHLGALLGGLVATALAWRGPVERSGWLFAAGSAGSVLLVAHSPYGMHDILALQHSNALGAGPLEVVGFLVAVGVMAVTVGRFHRELRLLAVDPAQARACGLAVGRWNLLIGAALGVLISVSVSSLGLLYSFGCLVLPTLVAARLTTAMWPLLILAPAIAVSGAVGGIVVGHAWDLPPGQSSVAVLVALYPLAMVAGWLLARCRRRRMPTTAALDEVGDAS